MSILDEPLVPVAGIVDAHGSLTMLMHRSYDRPMVDIGRYAAQKDRIAAMKPGVVYLVRGDLDNPLFAWPQYLLRTVRNSDSQPRVEAVGRSSPGGATSWVKPLSDR